jgi:nucleoid-associated protein YgaU
MNKETKVGLLVGLSFIVLFGVILSNQAPDIVAPPEKPMLVPAAPRGTQAQVIRQIERTTPAPEPVDLVVDAADEQVATPDVEAVEPAPVVDTAIADASDDGRLADTMALTASSAGDATKTITADNLGPEMADAEPGDEGMELVSSKVAADGTRTTVYIVKSGDNLSKISRLFYGEATNRNIDKIYDANKDKMPNKKTLKIGTPIQVPVTVADEKDKTGDELLSSGQFDHVAELKPAGKAKDVPVAKDLTPATEAKDASKPGLKDVKQTLARTAVAEVSDEALEDILLKRTASASSAQMTASDELSREMEPVDAAVKTSAEKKDPQRATKDLDKTALVSRENVRHYQIRKGDTWYKLAAKFMGDSRRWQELYALNDDILPNAAKLRTGVKIRIPAGKGRLDSVVE